MKSGKFKHLLPVVLASMFPWIGLQAKEILDGPTYTAFGAEKAGNAAGTIPAWTGKMDGVPKGLVYRRSGDPYPDPYAKEQPLFTITADNMAKYAANLGEGQKALFKKYPKTFVMKVYPSHRDAQIGKFYTERTAWNYKNGTKLANGIEGLQNYTGGIPFPFPKSAAEVMWNGRVCHFHPTEFGPLDDIGVYANGKKEARRLLYTAEFPFSNHDNFLGDVDDQIDKNAAYVLTETLEPDVNKGQIVIVHEALNQVVNERQAWAYMPGSRRVRRAPTVGFDTPDGPGGLITVDDALGFNGAMYKYEWKLIGKKEIYIPYHNYKFDLEPNLDKILTTYHVNPEYMRYELHRVWIVEADLKQGQRHIYGKRRFYLDEDTWLITLTESYDTRGDLWRTAMMNSLYDYLLKAYISRANLYHDLVQSAYVAYRLDNEKGPINLMGEPKGADFYSPSNLRQAGMR